MPSQNEQNDAREEEYLTLNAPATLDDIAFLQSTDSMVLSSARRSGPKCLSGAAVITFSVAAALTLLGGVGARSGPRLAPRQESSVAAPTASRGPIAASLARDVEWVRAAHVQNPDYPEANHEAIELAKTWSTSMVSAADARRLNWVHPSVSANDFGDVVFEWWNGPKTLAVYFDTAGVKFVQSPGRDIAQMRDGDVSSPEHFGELLGWLLTEKKA